MKLITRFMVMLSIVLSGCGSIRPTHPPDALNCELSKFTVKDIYDDWRVYIKDHTKKDQRKNLSFNVLSLSAGGQFGAYGAGFLLGWRSVENAPKPGPRSDIQVVTGVSTGAILATHAFVNMDKEIKKKYETLSGDQIYKSRTLPGYIWANSLLDTSGKDRLISENITSEIIDKVTEEKGRFLYIGIVNLDSGEFVRIDMVKLARELKPKKRRDQCYRAVIGASSAIPIAFSPKFIDSSMWVDGGTRRHIFITFPPKELLQSTATRRLYSIIHSDLSVANKPVRNGVLQIAGKTANLFIDQGMKDSIRLQDQLASKCPDGSDCGPSNRLFETYYAAAASAAASCKSELKKCGTSVSPTSDDMFCNAFMKCLAKKGMEDGEAYANGTHKWLTIDDLCLGSSPVCAPSPEFNRKFAQ